MSATPQLTERMRHLAECATPSGYARLRLGFRLHPKQAAVLDGLFSRSGTRVVNRCGNEVGKTRKVICAAVLYAVEIRRAVVVSTAGTFRQIESQLMPALKDQAHKFDPKLWEFQNSSIKRHEKGQWSDAYLGVSTKDEHFFQGYHKDENRPLLVIIDEWQGVSAEISKAAEDRCNPTWFLGSGSPGDPAGAFYEAETTNAKHYSHHKLNRMECLKEDGYWLDRADIDRLIAKHGQDNPFVQSTVFGEFTNKVEGSMISLSEYDRCMENPPAWTGRDMHGFCDFAAGRDKNVFALRLGNKVELRRKWVERDTMSAVGVFLGLFVDAKRQHGLLPEMISGDADGLGLPMVQRMHEMEWRINEFHGGKEERFGNGYRNQIAEAWGEGMKKIIAGEVILPDDKDLKAQILGRKAKVNSSGQFEIERKEDYKKRCGESPDEADALFGCLMPAPQSKSVSFLRTNNDNNWRHQITDDQPQIDGERRYFQ